MFIQVHEYHPDFYFVIYYREDTHITNYVLKALELVERPVDVYGISKINSNGDGDRQW